MTPPPPSILARALLWTMAGIACLVMATKVPGAQTAAGTQPAAAMAGDPSGVSPSGPLSHADDSLHGYAPGETDSNIIHAMYSINMMWVLICAFLVMFMQTGFALLETGLCRAKNAAHTMSMNFLVYALGMISFWAVGFALMCGGSNGIPAGAHHTPIGGPGGIGGVPQLNHMVYLTILGKPFGLFGAKGFFLSGSSYDAAIAVYFLFMMVFMDTAATIPTGALAERWKFSSFFLFSLLVGSFIYPIYACWMWGGGWLAQLGLNFKLGHGAVDFAGSSVVHMQGGVMALVTAWLMGPRIGKYDSEGRPRPILGHHIPMVMTGTFILAFGWFGFNAGSAMAGTNHRIGLIAVNTMLASGAGALVSTLYLWLRFGKPDPSMMCNGLLAGLVAITAPCAFVAPWAAVLIGAIAGLLSDWSVFFWERRGIDDPVGAISVHGVSGLWGCIAVGLFADGTFTGANGFYNGVAGGVRGLFYGDSSQLTAQFIAAITCFIWNFVVAGLGFILIGKLLGSNRVPPEIEIAGLDIPEMGAPGYPEFITPIAPEMVYRSPMD
jgi:Amt family ammonium transporter